MPDNIKALPPDLYSRNTIISYLIHKLISRPDYRVLDVGGRDSKLNAFINGGGKYYVLDKKQPTGPVDFTYITGDAIKIPFSDRNFDVVVASDMLEHVEDADREKVLNEMFRVSKNFLVIGAPFKNNLVEKAEQYVRDQYLNNSGREHPFLVEHDKYGLPDEEKLDQYLDAKGVSYFKINEGNLMNWYIQQLYSGNHYGEEINSETYKFNTFYNEHLQELGTLREPTYRIIYCIAKEQTLSKAEMMADLHSKNVWKAEVFMELLKMAFDDLRTVVERKKHALNKLHTELNSRQHEIAQNKVQYEETLAIARKSVEAHRHAILELRNFLAEKEKALQYLKLTLYQKIEILETVQAEKEKLLNRVEDLQKELLKLSGDYSKIKAENDQMRSEWGHKDQLLETQRLELEAVNADLENHRRELRKVVTSRAWRAVMAYGKVKSIIKKPFQILHRGWKVLTVLGPKTFAQKLQRRLKLLTGSHNLPEDPYQLYVKQNSLGENDLNRIHQQMKAFSYQPVISIITAVYNVDEKWLKKAVESVKSQLYPRFELCICDDASTKPYIKDLLKKYAAEDKRIRVCFNDKNSGIVKTMNNALKMANGAYVTILDHDDELSRDALFEVAKALQEEKYDLIYSDEDKISEKGLRCDPYFKPDWSPDLLLSNNYICHLAVFRKKLVDDLGGLREGFDGSQDYDLVLRFTEKTSKIKHIPKILYHWRKLPGSAAAEVDAKPYAHLSAKKALEDAVQRRRLDAQVVDGLWKGSYRIHRNIKPETLVSIIIPFKDKIDVLKKCVSSILEKSTYRNFELILVDNRSEETATQEYLKQVVSNSQVRLLKYDGHFNYSRINNLAAQEAKGEVLILLNNDTEVITPGWIEAMLEQVLRPDVGAVGAKLVYPDHTIQHAGVVIGIRGIANCAFNRKPELDHGYFGQASAVRNVSAVTGACMMLRKEVFLKIGGLDEQNLGVTFNDIDLCLRLRENGYMIVYTPFAELYHHESLTRGYDVDLKEINYMQQKYAKLLAACDPFYNPNLTRERFDFSLRIEDKA